MKDTQSYTYKFDGLRWVHPGGDVSYDPPPAVVEQLRAYGRHYNDRIEIVRWSRQQYREARTTHVPDFSVAETAYADARAEVERVRTEIKALRKEARRRAEGTELRAKLTEAVQARKAAGAALRLAKESATESPSLKLASRGINDERTRREKAIRAATPAHWGTYLMAEDASQIAASKAKVDPAFRRWTPGLPVTVAPPCPEGKIGVQIQSTKPLTVAGLYDGRDTRIQLDAPPPKTRHRAEWVRGRIRIGSDGRAPVWAEFEVRNRHDMPLDARITWAWINRRRFGTHWRHALCIGVERAAPAQHANIDRALAIDINMRLVPGGVRLGYSYDGNALREYVVPQEIVDKLRHGEEVSSSRDLEFDRFRDELAGWLKTADVSPWVREKTEHLGLWHSHERLAAVVLHWRVNRFDGDEAMYPRAEQWRAQDRHLANYRHGDRRAAENRRLDLYRRWAAEILRDHGTVVVAAWDWSQIARRPKVEDENAVPEAVRSMRFAVAPSELVAVLSHACRHRGGRFVKAALGKLGELGCLACSSKAIVDDHEAGWVKCMSCGRRILRDEMQARVLYASRERFGGDDGTGAARDGEPGETAGDSASAVS
jgi:DNA-directed RNA polymerase subunit RPC12/RpoP